MDVKKNKTFYRNFAIVIQKTAFFNNYIWFLMVGNLLSLKGHAIFELHKTTNK